MAYDSSLAQLNIETSDILPKEFVESLAINLVFDNIDFGKEVKKNRRMSQTVLLRRKSHSRNRLILRDSL